jgi:hypothetical protein
MLSILRSVRWPRSSGWLPIADRLACFMGISLVEWAWGWLAG